MIMKKNLLFILFLVIQTTKLGNVDYFENNERDPP